MLCLGIYVFTTIPVEEANARWATLFSAVLVTLMAIYLIWEMVVVYRSLQPNARLTCGHVDGCMISRTRTCGQDWIQRAGRHCSGSLAGVSKHGFPSDCDKILLSMWTQ